jgi:N-acetylglucosaminyldiphosphoundecaprenol N-acetyl-beta-D-mannosaminyltransferase
MDADIEIMPTSNAISDIREADSIRENELLQGASVSSVTGSDGCEVSFLGLKLHPRSIDELNQLVEQGVTERRKWVITNHNLHSVYLFHRQKKLCDFYATADWTFIDGMALIALGRLYGYPLKREQRVTLADWTYPLMELSSLRGWRVFYVGSPKGVADKGAEILRAKYPGLQIEVSDGYFDARTGSLENEALLQRINAYEPDILMVGMSMPRQEYWTYDNFARLGSYLILSSNGAAMDYVAGTVETPPRWMGQLGFEWAFRLVKEPRRLFSRYLVEPWYVLMLFLGDRLRAGAGFKDSGQSASKV